MAQLEPGEFYDASYLTEGVTANDDNQCVALKMEINRLRKQNFDNVRNISIKMEALKVQDQQPLNRPNTHCNVCNQNKNRSEFSKKQLKKAESASKCKECTNKSEVLTDIHCNKCNQNKSRSEFSACQLNKPESDRMCRVCVRADRKVLINPLVYPFLAILNS